MENPVTNIVKARGEVIAALLNSDGNPDFNQIIPYDSDLDIDKYCILHEAEETAKSVYGEVCRRNRIAKLDDDCFRQFILMIRNKRKHGYYHCLDFARSAWGTVRNASDHDLSRSSNTQIVFETSSSAPFPVFIALSKKFPTDTIEVSYADEDIGSNCGEITLLDGDVISGNIARDYEHQGDDEIRYWRKFAFNICYPNEDPRMYGYDQQFNRLDGL